MSLAISKSKKCLLTGIKQLLKFANKNKRGFFITWDDVFGSPNLVTKFESSQKCTCAESDNNWENAIKLDTIEFAKNGFKFEIGSDDPNLDILKLVYENDNIELPLLPCPVDLMNQAQLLAYIVPQIKLDYIEQGLPPMSKIPWGDATFKPKCWADDVWEWSKIGNIRQKQQNKPENGATIPDVLKASIKNRLMEKNINNVDAHVSSDFTDILKKNRLLEVLGWFLKPHLTFVQTTFCVKK